MPEEIHPADQAAVTAVLENFDRVWDRHDAKGFSALFAPDAEWINVLGHILHGQAEIEREHAHAFSTFLKQTVLTVHERTISWIRPDVAVVRLMWKTTGDQTIDGRPVPPRNGMVIMILAKEEGRWLIMSGHNIDYAAMSRHMAAKAGYYQQPG